MAAMEGDTADSAVQRALCLMHLGKPDIAHQLVRSFLETTEVGEESNTSPTWLLNYLAELAAMLGDRNLAAKLIPRLDSIAALISCGPNFFHTCIARHLGGCAAVLGDGKQAKKYCASALTLCTSIGYRPEIALTHLQLAELLLEHYPDERPAAIGHLDFAIAEFRDMKMQPSLERALRHRELLKA
jgi:hypothetical protein